jgi:TfoX/Sxy family transcriptional regulator of competence genes
MPYNEKLADKVREIITLTHQDVEEKKMFGGLCFMVNGKMCVGIMKDQLMVRLDRSKVEELLETEECMPMQFTGRIMKGFVLVNDTALTKKSRLNFWLQLALEYNKIAKASKQKK